MRNSPQVWRRLLPRHKLASSTVGVAAGVATAATAPSGAPVCHLAFPVSPAISDLYKMIIVISGLQELPAKPHTAAQVILVSGMLSPPTATEGGFTFTLPLAPGIPLFIAEERPHGWATVYRRTVASAGSAEDLATLEHAMPMWVFVAWGDAAGRHHRGPVRAS
jgi:hypothetical protein